jgi:hypothetical protein
LASLQCCHRGSCDFFGEALLKSCGVLASQIRRHNTERPVRLLAKLKAEHPHAAKVDNEARNRF